MNSTKNFSRRKFMGGLALTAGYLGLSQRSEVLAQPVAPEGAAARHVRAIDDSVARLCFNENNYGPPESVLQAMTAALKYANRYDMPDMSNIVQAIAEHHGVSADHVLLGSGSTEILNVADATFLEGGKKVIGVEPTFGSVYEFAVGLRSNSIRLPLLADHRQDIPAMIKAANGNRDAGFVYVCNPNNPTGAIVPKTEIKQLLDSIPKDLPVLVDEAYHHFVDSAEYATLIPYVIEGRPVIVARTFSKIVGLAGMRLGYAVAPPELIQRLRVHATGTINIPVKWAAAAALKDTAAQAKVKALTLELRKKTTTELAAHGYDVIPSEANFFMVHIRRPVTAAIQEFRQRGVQVGRPFPPMLDYMRVSVGTADDMARFTAAFKEIFPAVKPG